jgi:hypothetical protein
MNEIERLAMESYSTNAVEPMPPVTAESIREAMQSVPKLPFELPIKVTTRQLAELKRRFPREPGQPDDYLRYGALGFGVPVEVDDENPTVPESQP